jgi:TPR repeat protein
VAYAAMMEAGESGVRNYDVAVKIYREAAGKGHPGAMVALGSMLENGRGVNGDFRQAYMLYQLASQAGFKAATESLDKLKKRLNPKQLELAEAFVASGGKDAANSPGPAPAPANVTPAPEAQPKPKPAPATPPKPPAGSKPAKPKTSR